MTILTNTEQKEFHDKFLEAVEKEFGHCFPQHAKQLREMSYPWNFEGHFKQSFAKWFEERRNFYDIQTAAAYWAQECGVMYLYDWDEDEWRAIFENAYYRIFHEYFGPDAYDDRHRPIAVGKPWKWIETDKSPLHKLWNKIAENNAEECAQKWFDAVNMACAQA